MKTSELTGAALDWAVAKCEDDKEYFEPFYADPYDGYGLGPIYCTRKYSSDWYYGGPIIEREKIRLDIDAESLEWYADVNQTPGCWLYCGPTPLIAAMRCYCCAKLGNEIEIPQELQPCQPPNL